jgi:hypothetical protein
MLSIFYRDRLELGPQRAQQRDAPRTSGADPRSGRQRGEASARRPDERITWILTLGISADRQAVRELRGHVLGTVHGEIDAPVQQGILDLPDPGALAADLGQRAGRDIARGLDAHQLDVLSELSDLVRNDLRLRECQLTPPGAQAQHAQSVSSSSSANRRRTASA